MGNALHLDNVQLDQEMKEVDQDMKQVDQDMKQVDQEMKQVDQEMKQVHVPCRPLPDGEGGRPGAAGEGSAACR